MGVTISETKSQREEEEIKGSQFKRILAAVDGSENSLRACLVAANLAKKNEAELIVLNVIPAPSFLIKSPIGVVTPPISPDQYYAFVKEEAEIIIDRAASIAKKQGVRARKEILRGSTSTVQSITEFASNENIDLIVIGTRGLGGFSRMLLGSVSGGVVQHAICSVLVVR